MKRIARSERRLSDRLRLRLGRALVCSVCDEVFARTGTWDDYISSPLAGYVTLNTCPTCFAHRAVYPLQAACFMRHVHSTPPGTPGTPEGWKWLEDMITIDGGTDNGHSWPAVHVYESGVYIPMRTWINSDFHVAADADHEERPRLRMAA